jgi:uncharacterized protein YndB with AHSA1/START domain
MIHIEHSIQIGRSRSEVFDFLTNVENLPRWQANLVQSVPISDGPARVGFQFEETIHVMMRRIRAVCTVTEIKANERFAFEMRSNGPLDCDAHFELQPVANGTRLTLIGTARLRGVWRLLQPIVAGELRKETLAELMAMKALLEVPQTAVAPACI